MGNKIAKWALGALLVLILCPVRYHAATTGLDPSWAVGLNRFHVEGLVFGRDVLFTYGPLGWAVAPMPMGSNLGQGIALQLALWLAFAATVAFLMARTAAPLPNLAVAVACAATGARLFFDFGYAGADFFLEFLTIFWIACALEAAPGFFYLACAAAVLLAFIKVSTAIAALAAILAVPVLLLLIRDSRAPRFAAAAFVGVPCVFAAAFLAYAGDGSALVRYLRSAMELSAGNSSAMSLEGLSSTLYAGTLMASGFAVLAGAFWWTGQRRLALLCVALLGPLFLEHKHSFTRADSHEAILFTFAPLALLTALWFWRDYKAWPVLAAVAVIVAPWAYVVPPAAMVHRPLLPLTTLAEITSMSALKQRLTAESEVALAPDRLPPELLARTAGRSVTIYPWEVSYAAANPGLPYRPLPVFMAYNAYTTWLDRTNAEFLESDRRPDFILFDFASVDGRHPLLDCPATFLAMYRQYEFDSRFGPHLLLRRRAQALSATAAGSGPHVRLASIPARYTAVGKLTEFLFRTGPMYLTLSGSNGNTMYARVPPLVLDNPVPLNIVPMDLDDTADLFAGKPLRESFSTIALNGPARDLFVLPGEAAVSETGLPAPGARSEPPPTVPQTALAMERLSLDYLNNEPVGAIGSRETLTLRDDTGFVSLRGWAILAAKDDTLWLEAAGRLYRTRPFPNPAPAALLPPGTPVATFEAVIPARVLGSAPATLRIFELSASGGPARVGDRTLTVQIQPR